MVKTISTEKLKSLRKSNEGFLLIDVLSKEQFDKDHIPGARNVPLDTVDFVEEVAARASGSKGRRVVLYCGSQECNDSARAAQMLVASGFTNVLDYEGGLASWNESQRARAGARVRS